MIRSISLYGALLVSGALSACGGDETTKYRCPIEMNAAGTKTSGSEKFTYIPKGMIVQMEQMNGGEMRTVNLPATVKGDELSFQTLSSDPIFYKLNLKTLRLDVDSKIWNPTGGGLSLTGTGTCTPE